jgi:hypothetical protein
VSAPSARCGRARLRYRIARARDRDRVCALLDRLSPTTVRARYLHTTTAPGLLRDGELTRIFDRNEAEHVVMLAVAGTEIRGIGEFVNQRSTVPSSRCSSKTPIRAVASVDRCSVAWSKLPRARGILTLTGDVAYGNARAAAMVRRGGRPLQVQISYGSLHFDLRIEA